MVADVHSSGSQHQRLADGGLAPSRFRKQNDVALGHTASRGSRRTGFRAAERSFPARQPATRDTADGWDPRSCDRDSATFRQHSCTLISSSVQTCLDGTQRDRHRLLCGRRHCAVWKALAGRKLTRQQRFLCIDSLRLVALPHQTTQRLAPGQRHERTFARRASPCDRFDKRHARAR